MDRSPIRVLLVEDNPGDARLVQEYLSEFDIELVSLDHVDSLEEALRYLSKEHTDVLLLDLDLPDAHGIDSVDHVRRASPDTTIIVLTGTDDPETGVQVIKRGAQDFLTKADVDGKQLRRAILHSLVRHRLNHEAH